MSQWLPDQNPSLKNGAFQIARDRAYVLAVWEKNGRDEYMTWMIDRNGDCHHGHYFQDCEVAVANYNNRRKAQ